MFTIFFVVSHFDSGWIFIKLFDFVKKMGKLVNGKRTPLLYIYFMIEYDCNELGKWCVPLAKMEKSK